MWTLLTAKNRTSRDIVKTIGAAIDAQFCGDSKEHWKTFWNHEDRKRYLKSIQKNVAALTKAAKAKGPCDNAGSHVAEIQDSAYYFGQIKSQRFFVKSPCAQSGAAELTAIIESGLFDRVFLETGSSNIACITHPVVIHCEGVDYAMGRYCVKWSFQPLAQADTGGRLQFPAHANLEALHYTQPHIQTSGAWCGGELENALPNLFKSGLIADAMTLIIQYLNTGEGHPYHNIGYWRPGGSASAKPVCAYCHRRRAVRTCSVCLATSCKNCWGNEASEKCPRCGNKSTRKIMAKISERKKTNVKKRKKT